MKQLRNNLMVFTNKSIRKKEKRRLTLQTHSEKEERRENVVINLKYCQSFIRSNLLLVFIY